MTGIPDPGGVSGVFAALERTGPLRRVSAHERASAAEIKWSATRVACGAVTPNGHRCGRAAGHGQGGCTCVCEAERALQRIAFRVPACAVRAADSPAAVSSLPNPCPPPGAPLSHGTVAVVR